MIEEAARAPSDHAVSAADVAGLVDGSDLVSDRVSTSDSENSSQAKIDMPLGDPSGDTELSVQNQMHSDTPLVQTAQAAPNPDQVVGEYSDLTPALQSTVNTDTVDIALFDDVAEQAIDDRTQAASADTPDALVVTDDEALEGDTSVESVLLDAMQLESIAPVGDVQPREALASEEPASEALANELEALALKDAEGLGDALVDASSDELEKVAESSADAAALDAAVLEENQMNDIALGRPIDELLADEYASIDAVAQLTGTEAEVSVHANDSEGVQATDGFPQGALVDSPDGLAATDDDELHEGTEVEFVLPDDAQLEAQAPPSDAQDSADLVASDNHVVEEHTSIDTNVVPTESKDSASMPAVDPEGQSTDVSTLWDDAAEYSDTVPSAAAAVDDAPQDAVFAGAVEPHEQAALESAVDTEQHVTLSDTLRADAYLATLTHTDEPDIDLGADSDEPGSSTEQTAVSSGASQAIVPGGRPMPLHDAEAFTAATKSDVDTLATVASGRASVATSASARDLELRSASDAEMSDLALREAETWPMQPASRPVGFFRRLVARVSRFFRALPTWFKRGKSRR